VEPTSLHIEQLRAFLADTLEISRQDMRHIRFSKEHPPHITVACIYATIIKASSECLLLLSQPTISTGGILRGIVESWADLSAVIKDGHYVNRMLATFYVEKLRYMKSMISAPLNPHFVDMVKHLDPQTEKLKVTAELASIEKRGYKRLTNADRLKAGGIEDIYHSFYWQLCLQSHNNAGALEYRHISKKGDNFEVMLCNANSTIELINYFDPLIAILVDCAIKVHRFLKTRIAPDIKIVHQYEQRRVAFDALRKAIIAGSAPHSP
jgi:hypothetical protein